VSKAPAFQFYVRDWLSDPQLRMCCFAVRGMWIDFLCFMWEAPERGLLKGTISNLARLIGATESEMILFLQESMKYKFADVTCNGNVTDCNTEVTLCNRRMFRDQKEKENTRLRVRKYREKQNGNKKVTPPSSSSSSSSSTKVLLSEVSSDTSSSENPSKKPNLKPPKCPAQEIINLYHEICPELPTVRAADKIKKKIALRWREDFERQNLEWWRSFFEDWVHASDFLMGRVIDFQANLDWILGPKNFVKILNGQYVNRGPKTGSRLGDANYRASRAFIDEMRGESENDR